MSSGYVDTTPETGLRIILTGTPPPERNKLSLHSAGTEEAADTEVLFSEWRRLNMRPQITMAARMQTIAIPVAKAEKRSNVTVPPVGGLSRPSVPSQVTDKASALVPTGHGTVDGYKSFFEEVEHFDISSPYPASQNRGIPGKNRAS